MASPTENIRLPANPERILLVNPTKYLGNLLIAGGLMQSYADYCKSRQIKLKIVIDESFRALCETSFPPDSLIFFPRQQISRAGFFRKIQLYWHCLQKMRSFKADLAFNIEEDSATSHLTRLSAAGYKLGCSQVRHTKGYDAVLPIHFEHRAAEKSHRWNSFYDVFALLNMPEPQKSYIHLTLADNYLSLREKLTKFGWDASLTTVALHAGATKEYKKWPLEHMAVLIGKLLAAGLQPVLLGAGSSDAQANKQIIDLLERKHIAEKPVDLCNQLSLLELAQFFKTCQIMVGNDSGPFHLGSALGIKGLVLWGPTNKSIWGPMGKNSEIINGSFTCDPACNKGHCLHQHRCLMDISPDKVFKKIQDSLAKTVS